MKMTKKQAKLDLNNNDRIDGEDFKLLAKKKYGGKITYRMGGGKVVSVGYDD